MSEPFAQSFTGFQTTINHLNNYLPSSFPYVRQFVCFFYHLKEPLSHCVPSANVKTEPHPTRKTSLTELLLLSLDTKHVANSMVNPFEACGWKYVDLL